MPKVPSECADVWGFIIFSDLHIFPCKSLKKWARRPFRRRAHFLLPSLCHLSLSSLLGIAQQMRSDRRKIMYPSLLALILVWTKAFGENGFMVHRYNPCASRKDLSELFLREHKCSTKLCKLRSCKALLGNSVNCSSVIAEQKEFFALGDLCHFAIP